MAAEPELGRYRCISFLEMLGWISKTINTKLVNNISTLTKGSTLISQ